jgi:hypothetical protein
MLAWWPSHVSCLCRYLAIPLDQQKHLNTHILNLMEDILEHDAYIQDHPYAQAVLQMSMEQLMVQATNQKSLNEQLLQLLEKVPMMNRMTYNISSWWAYQQGQLMCCCFCLKYSPN